MIDEALNYVRTVLSRQLSHQFGVDGEPAILNHLVESGGSVPLSNQNKMVLTLINLEHETAKQFYGGTRPDYSTKTAQQVQPAIRFNLDILITAHFDVYSEALKFLSATIAFFQAHPTMTSQLFPDMPSSLDQLQFEIENSPYERTHNLWSALGAKYQPSIIYKVRHVTVQADQISGEVARIQQTANEAKP
ncbi:hypothetical protein Vspart_03349 [Vibrio spartinae]|uniref:Pvc16 N-terminal domain-containing protein n=1 Tax=Vibrio spartinae TaxID=1918945 RepID=A0A1N6MA25_9VIBR|nr:hypothetical protein Vspart_03349 [Vibrio spartinae]SIO96190.1 hypothetical protein VSP9026_03972 [Vibrio spartinae]